MCIRHDASGEHPIVHERRHARRDDYTRFFIRDVVDARPEHNRKKDHDTQPDCPLARHHVLLGANGDHGIDPGRAHHRHDAGHERHAEEHDRADTE